MLNINDLKPGTKIIFNNAPYEVIYTEHSKLGRGGGILRTKIKNLLNGATTEKTFAGQEKLQEATIDLKQAQFLYCDEVSCFFMDNNTFDQFEIAKNQVGDKINFLKDGAMVEILFFEDNPINIQLPLKINLKINYTEPGFKGNTASTVQKPATLETGAHISVPLFIKDGDEIVVDTRTGNYVERV